MLNERNDRTSEKLVLVDFDGVLVPTFPLFCKILENQHPERQFTPADIRAHLDRNFYDSPLSQGRDMSDFFAAKELGLQKLKPVAGIRGVIATLAHQYSLVVVSSSESLLIESYLSAHDMDQEFEAILGCDVDTSKTKKIRHILEEYGTDAENAVMVTDTTGDIHEALAAGVQSIAVSWGFHTRDALVGANPRAVVDDPQALVQAVRLYFYPDESVQQLARTH